MEYPERYKCNYIWNFFYYNPKDERVIVPKANPDYGVTFNFAKRKAYLYMSPILLIPAFILFLIYFF